jgi:pyruvate kinase
LASDTISEPTKSRNYKRKTKIVCTMGPKCWSEEAMLGELLDAGLNVARFNFSHGDQKGAWRGPGALPPRCAA